MGTDLGKSRRWAAFTALGLGFIGMLISVSGASLFFIDQLQIQGPSIWPLPALVLIDWAVLGFLGFFGAYFGARPSFTYWSRVAWFVVGALLPLVILGAFSIGTFVLISLPFFLVSAFLITRRQGLKWSNSVGLLMLGVVSNLALVFIFIDLGSLH